MGHLTDSGYSSNIYPHSMDDVQNGAQSDYSTLGLDNEPAYEGKNNSTFSSHEMNSSVGSLFNSSSFYERSLKTSLDESETKRMLLLEKLREAHLTIQVNICNYRDTVDLLAIYIYPYILTCHIFAIYTVVKSTSYSKTVPTFALFACPKFSRIVPFLITVCL